MFLANRAAAPPVTAAELQSWAHKHAVELTYTCVPPGSGRRVGLDRDLDGYLDGDEVRAGS